VEIEWAGIKVTLALHAMDAVTGHAALHLPTPSF
jgi:hypothetical protein